MNSKDLNISVFRPVSTAQVLENLVVGERVISAKMIESDPFTDGEQKEIAEELVCDGIDEEGQSYSLSVTVSNSIEATWLPLGKTNHVVAPNVRRGERVQIWQAGDDDRYYWTELGLDRNLRRGETVVLAFSNRFDNDDSELSLEECYFIEVSTHLQHILLQTSKSNGEDFLYQVQLNTKDSFFVLKDDQEQHFFFDSKNKILRLHNADGSFVELNRKIISMFAKDSINAEALKLINMKAKTVNVKADDCNITAETTVDGNCTVTKKLTAATVSAGSIAAGAGGISSGGNIESDGVVRAKDFVRT